MVIIAGYNPYDGILELYDTAFDTNHGIQTLKLHDSDEHKIIDLFDDILRNYNKKIHSLCAKLGISYRNKFRKQFIRVANSFGIKYVRIIGRQMALLQSAFTHMPTYREKEGAVWIFEISINFIYWCVWEGKHNDIWRFKGRFKREKDAKLYTLFIRADDLRAIKSELNTGFKKPLIIVVCDYLNIKEKEKSEFKKIILNYENVFFFNSYKWSTWALSYGKNPVKSELLLGRNISVVVDNTIIIENGHYSIIPSDSSIEMPIEHYNQKAKVVEDGVDTKRMVFGAKGIYEIKLNVEENGIFYIGSNYSQNTMEEQLQIESDNLNNKKNYIMPPKTVENYQTSNAVGIDFGTTQCCVAVIRRSGTDCVQLDSITYDRRTMPSYVAYDERNPKCGQIAVNRMRYFEKCTVFDCKRMLGKTYDEIAIDLSWPFITKKLADDSFQIVLKHSNKTIKLSPEEVSSSILKHIKAEVDEYQHKDLKEAVIAIPSAFTEKQKTALLTAAILAGWEEIHFIPEPIAAAFAYSTEKEFPDNSKLLLFDFGGGTVDVCIVNIASGNLQLLSFDGNYYLGGRDFDTLLYNHFDGILKHKYNIDVTAKGKKYLLLIKCQEIKHELSVMDKSWLDVDDFDGITYEQINVSVQEFNSMATDNMTKITNVILSTLKKAHLHKNEINYIVQVGGSSRIPVIKKLLLDMFPSSIHECSQHPECSISQGAALYAYYLEHKK